MVQRVGTNITKAVLLMGNGASVPKRGETTCRIRGGGVSSAGDARPGPAEGLGRAHAATSVTQSDFVLCKLGHDPGAGHETGHLPGTGGRRDVVESRLDGWNYSELNTCTNCQVVLESLNS